MTDRATVAAGRIRRAAWLTALFALGHIVAPGAAQAQTVRTPPYDAGVLCEKETSVVRDEYGLRTPVRQSCWSDDRLSKHGVLLVGGTGVPGTDVSIWVPDCVFPLCGCLGPLCSGGGQWHYVRTDSRGAPSSAAALVRVVPDRTGSLAVSADVSGLSSSPVCIEAANAIACASETAPEATLALTATVTQGEPVWIAVRTGPADLAHPWVAAPGLITVRSVSYAIT